MIEGSELDYSDVVNRWISDFREVRPTAWSGGGRHALNLKGGASIDLEFSRDDYTKSLVRIIAVIRSGEPVLLARRFDGPATETSEEALAWEVEERGGKLGGFGR